jgi:dTDP-4-dehydrorhamnose reductase
MPPRRVALIGAGGQLASDLARVLPGEVLPWTHAQVELTSAPSLAEALDGHGPDMVINTAAYNLVDQAEDEPAAAFAVNALGVRLLARACAARRVKLVHISTDYVFGGDALRRTPYAEDDPPSPVSVYGASKLTGEYFVRAAAPGALIVRTCGLYGRAATRAKGNFVETMLRLGRERPALRVVDDQICTPSYTADVARGIGRLVELDAEGVYHVVNAGSTTWCALAREIMELAGLPVRVTPITTQEFGAKARRPAYSVLSCNRAEQLLGAPLPEWRDALRRYLMDRADPRSAD